MGWLKQHNGDDIKRLSELEERSIKIILSEKYGEKKKKTTGCGGNLRDLRNNIKKSNIH